MKAPGLELEPLQQEPRALPAGGGWLYYQVKRGKKERYVKDDAGRAAGKFSAMLAPSACI